MFLLPLPGQVYDLERDLLDRLGFAKSWNGSMPNPPIYSFDGTQVARWSVKPMDQVHMSSKHRWEIKSVSHNSTSCKFGIH